MGQHPGKRRGVGRRLGLDVLEGTKRRPALKNRCVGHAEIYKGQHNREPLRATDGVKYFRNTLRLPLPRL